MGVVDEDIARCQQYPLQVLDNQHGVLPNTAVPTHCPVRISAKRGQTVRLYLYDFSTKPPQASAALFPSNASAGDAPAHAHCHEGGPVYGKISDKLGTDRTFCQQSLRLSMIYTSVGHVVDVTFNDVTAYGSRFLLKYSGAILCHLFQLDIDTFQTKRC